MNLTKKHGATAVKIMVCHTTIFSSVTEPIIKRVFFGKPRKPELSLLLELLRFPKMPIPEIRNLPNNPFKSSVGVGWGFMISLSEPEDSWNLGQLELKRACHCNILLEKKAPCNRFYRVSLPVLLILWIILLPGAFGISTCWESQWKSTAGGIALWKELHYFGAGLIVDIACGTFSGQVYQRLYIFIYYTVW